MNRDTEHQLELLGQMLGSNAPGQEATLRHGNVVQRDAQDPVQGEGTSIVEIRPDTTRELRKGAPEVIFAETKTGEQTIRMAQTLLAGTGRAIISRVPAETMTALQATFAEYETQVREAAHAMVIYQPGYVRKRSGGHVGVISAGTSDVPVADEAALLAEEMGCQVTRIYDVGVAGLHRLIEPLQKLLADGVDVLIVAAGMDGALPSVVAGLVPVPVIGLPTSVGYGIGGGGVAALLSMLQTCAPGLSVVNIDNGVGAGITAGLIANRVAQARKQH
ncbi:hypothetical protein EI42_01416 [Thermosporothrix hazakensis]|uniref:PurE domain-containing protein n=1 Tax=Thermosporothrix hazakensis TaxID=644383 RepID=A0A326UKD2_THEHA|nr:hypothetical protein EI42_01416 [Thermosporothrix hazakensis]